MTSRKPTKRQKSEAAVERFRRSRFEAMKRPWRVWVRQEPGTVTTVADIVEMYVERHECASGTWMVYTDSVRPYIEYHWSRQHHRTGSVPTRGDGPKYAAMRGLGPLSGRSESESEEEWLRHMREADPEGLAFGGSRWDYLVEYMREHGWRKDDPGHIDIDLLGNAKLGEGNHRVNVALEIGLDQVPMQFHYVERVTWSKGKF